MVSRYAALPLLTASRSPSTMRSTAPSTGLPRRHFATSINSWSRRLSNWVWKTARLSASTPRWWNPTFITPPMPPCCTTNLAIVFLAQRFFSSRLGNQLFDGGVTRREDGIEDQTSVFGDLIAMRVGKFLNQPVGAQ